MAEGAAFYYQDDVVYDEKAAAKFLKPAVLEPLEKLVGELEKIDSFDEPSLEAAFQAVMDATGMKLGKIAQPVRVALTGKTFSPGIFEIIEVLGRENAIARLRRAIMFVSQSGE